MHVFTIRYNFAQQFDVPAEDAFKWCTNYGTNDFSLMGMKGKRGIQKLADDVIILTDTFYSDGKNIAKKKLVRLDTKSLSYSNTHLSGPNKYSQFLYRIIPEGTRSKLEFTGLQVNYSKDKPTKKEIISLQRKLRDEDSAIWKKLAKAMEKDLKL